MVYAGNASPSDAVTKRRPNEIRMSLPEVGSGSRAMFIAPTAATTFGLGWRFRRQNLAAAMLGPENVSPTARYGAPLLIPDPGTRVTPWHLAVARLNIIFCSYLPTALGRVF